ncbi:hypothetical protein HPB52_001768 [Rhipicephalus sanguineus]|uniref:Brinker DNA-binding domain-containing protein n=1 Tax=Rhipicephalus sanguineus TaxID=34632 RepID=A0A9D4QDZ9_RHISA|nr:hypothetical protein HPB52_001768 [Rhipicephalus sanguineus]
MAPNERSHYSAAYKRKVVLAAESSSNVQAGRDFGVDEKNVRRWRGQREKLFACAATRMAAAWDDIPGTLIVLSFKKCGISNALDGTEDCALFEDSDKEISDDDSE